MVLLSSLSPACKDIFLQLLGIPTTTQRRGGGGLPIDFGRGVARAVYLLVSQSFFGKKYSLGKQLEILVTLDLS